MTEAFSSKIIATIDSGTTRTRVRLWDGQKVIWQASRQVGCKDTARYGKAVLESALRELLTEAKAIHPFTSIVGSGMITSNLGLHEVPHLHAPISYTALAKAIVPYKVDDIGVIHFIRGVKTLPADPKLSNIARLDILRGEETEVIGLRQMLQLSGPVNFFHTGSHHKIIFTDDTTIRCSVTSLTGEMLHALSQQTILADSTLPLSDLVNVELDYWKAGLHTATLHGFGRAAFCVRIADQVLHATPSQATSFLLGAATSLDLPLIPTDATLILYGHRNITHPLALHLESLGMQTITASPEMSELSATVGAARLFKQYLESQPIR